MFPTRTCQSACRHCRRCTMFRSVNSDSSKFPWPGRTCAGVDMSRPDPVPPPRCYVFVCVHALPSLHDVPFGAFGFEQVPVAGSQVPATWHWSLAVHMTGLEPVQMPVWHVSVCVQALPSLHAVPFSAFGFEQVPVAGSHVPATWHWSLAEHVTGFAPVHVPAWQASVCVQALPSLHEVPSGALGFVQVPVAGLHVPATWH